MQLKKFSTFENWIPPTDVDETDVNKNYLRDIINGDFHNGFIQNAVAPLLVSLPTAIQSLINTGWELLSYKYFNHSTQGDVYISVLYKLITGTHTLKYYVNSTELFVDEINNNITIASKPTNISYDLSEDQFKVNLNVNATYTALTKTVILNLTFVYLSARVYITSTRERAASWYVFPRWIGWTLEEADTLINYDTENTNTFLETCDNNTYETHFNIESNFVWSASPTLPSFSGAAGAIGFYNTSSTNGLWGWFNIDGLKYLKTIKFKWGTGYLDQGYTALKVGITNDSVTTNADRDASWIEIYNSLYSSAQDNLLQEFEQDVNMVIGLSDKITESSFKVWIGIGLPGKSLVDAPYVNVREIELIALQGCMLCKDEDKQRNQIKTEFDVGLFDDPKLNVPYTNIDWRIANYEFYLNFNSIYNLYGNAEVVDGWTFTAAPYLRSGFVQDTNFPDAPTTLNFNYGLGATVRVDEQKQIYREIFYRSRVYFVRNDSKLYYSHISGTGLPQPDAFPYSEEDLFGYMITDSGAINKNLCATSLDEVVIITDKNNYIYTIESVAGTPFRKIKAFNGGKGILSVNSLAVDFNGMPLSDILFWSNRWGIFGYSGGQQPPQEITGITHRNFWRQASGTDTAFTIYNKATDEYWIQLTNFVMIYEATTNTWKKYELGFTIKDFVGIVSNYTYILSTDNKVYKLDPENTELLTCTVEFHDDICQPDNTVESYDSETQMKVLQDIYLSFKDAELTNGINAVVEIFVDDYPIDIILIPMNYKNYISRTPLDVTFGRIRAKLTLPPTSTNSKLKEFGLWYTISGISEVNINNIQEGIGQDTGHEIGVFG
jgi:hypothetical protein